MFGSLGDLLESLHNGLVDVATNKIKFLNYWQIYSYGISITRKCWGWPKYRKQFSFISRQAKIAKLAEMKVLKSPELQLMISINGPPSKKTPAQLCGICYIYLSMLIIKFNPLFITMCWTYTMTTPNCVSPLYESLSLLCFLLFYCGAVRLVESL